MPSQMMDQQGLSASPYFSGDPQFPADKQSPFWNINNFGMKTDAIAGTSCGVPVAGSPLEKLVHVDSLATNGHENLEQTVSFSLQRHAVGAERALSRSLNLWSSMDLNPVARSNPNAQQSWEKNNTISHYENGLFSSSMSEMFTRKLQLSSNDDFHGHSVDTVASHYEEEEPFQSLEEIEAQTIGNLLPDDDELLSGVVVDGIESKIQLRGEDDIEDLDLFNSVGGMDLGDDTSSAVQRNSEFPCSFNGQLTGTSISFNGEHPYGEHPYRTLFVRNINSNVEDSELQALFEQYGDIRTLYTACKHRGFVMISYFDIRAARNAMKALQNKPLRRRRLDIHYSIPKDNPSDKDVNQGTLVVSNLDASVTIDDIRQIFGAYGEVKEIREIPHRSNQKFVEFYDVRAADEALCALDKSDIAGKKIKVEPSRPGGARRSLMQPLPPDMEQEESGIHVQQSSAETLFSGISSSSISSISMESDASCVTSAGIQATLGSFIDNSARHEISSSVPNGLPSLLRAESGSYQAGLSESGKLASQVNYDFRGLPTLYPCSVPKYSDGLANSVSCNSDGYVPAIVSSLVENNHLGRISSNVEMCNDFSTSGNASGSLPGHHFMWSNTNHHQPPAFGWPNSPSQSNGICSPQNQHQLHGFTRSPSHMLNSIQPHHVGSAPAVNYSLWDRQNSYPGGSPEASGFHQGPLGNMRLSGSPLHHMDFVPHNLFPHVGGNSLDLPISSRNVLNSHHQRGMIYPPRNQMNMAGSFEHPVERARRNRSDGSSAQADNKKLYELDLDRIRRGEDNRTTLMIKNIPNKYTSKMLMAAIDERHRGTYDFIYLPIDFKNKCNVGYAFINMIDPSHIISCYETLNGKKWEKFNSEKVASLAYARIQGKAALVAHFQNSSLMNEDKRCRPILFHSDGTNAGDQVPFPMGVNVRSRPGKSRSCNNEENQLESPPNVVSKEEYTCGESSSSSGKESD
ncbi:protein MEI2-like 4 isoform X1 [Chenopodium quinoa]|uniref:protein MEI2-like 4 isoform X1 n=1 Tax=Chenopodium quinoa TaxID=63459 RepID=UPI000B79A85F|nr:protein MEI2-like 4 isoform X1 [Chenopodium quinoa]